MAPVLLKRWSPLFDLEREQIGAGPICICFPGLPLQYWCEEVFIRIGNALGTYLGHDRTFVESRSRTLARILVHLDTHERLEEKITLQWGRHIRIQMLDYEGILFRCRRCHKVGHLIKECPLIRKVDDSPLITLAPSRADSPIISWPISTGPSPVASSPVVEPGLSHSSPLMTRARSAAGAVLATGTPLNPALSFSDHIINASSSTFQPSQAPCYVPSPPINATTGPTLPSPASSSPPLNIFRDLSSSHIFPSV